MPPGLEAAIVDALTAVMETIAWPGVVIIMALESANIPIPSEITMPLAGWLLVEARGGSLVEVVVLGGFYGALGCTLGSVASYYLGYLGGRPLVEKHGKWIMVNPSDLDTADRWFARWGQWAAFISRLLPIVRTFISFPAGVFRIRFWPFAALSFIGSYLWCSLLALGGWHFGRNWEEFRAIMRPFDIPIAILLAIGLAVYVYKHVTHGLTRDDAQPTE